VGWIDSYHTGIQPTGNSQGRRVTGGAGSNWVFPGEQGDHLDKVSGYRAIKDLFIRAGLLDAESEIYSPHSMRKFTQSQMRKAGLNEGIVDSIIGHTSRTKRAYEDWDENESEWLEKCEEKMTWLTETIRVVEPDPRQEARIKELEGKVETLLGALAKIAGRKLREELRKELSDNSEVTDSGAKVGSGV